jgi:adenylyltransferase/sulfurtransferase
MAKVLIPTPLRQFADKHDHVSFRRDRGRSVDGAHREVSRSPQAVVQRRRQDASFVNVYLNDEDIRYLKKDATVVGSERYAVHRSQYRGGRDGGRGSARIVIERRNPALLAPPDHAGGRHGGAVETQAGQGADGGAGGLGAPLGLYLAAAGVGRIGIVDFDVVDFTNLQRQVIHGTKDVGRKKLDSAAETMQDINPYVQIDKHETALTSENALEIIKDYDMVVDGTDNFPTRYLINDACVLLKKPNVYGSIFRFEGQATIFAYPGGPVTGVCIPSRLLRAWFPVAPRADAGILPASSA